MAHIIYTSGVSALVQTPHQDTLDAADPGSGIGHRMIYRTPGGPYEITAAESAAITSDGTYAAYLG